MQFARSPHGSLPYRDAVPHFVVSANGAVSGNDEKELINGGGVPADFPTGRHAQHRDCHPIGPQEAVRQQPVAAVVSDLMPLIWTNLDDLHQGTLSMADGIQARIEQAPSERNAAV